MFRHIFNFELDYWKKNPLAYVFAGILFLLTFLSMWGMSAEANTGDNLVMMNSYYKINNMANTFSLLIYFILPAFIGVSVFRDYSSRMYTLFYSFPFAKRDYLFAKFLSAFLAVVFIIICVTIGLALGCIMPGVKQAALLPFDLLNYLQLVFVFLLPNMLFFGAVVFALTLFTRNIYIGFIGVILLIIVQNFGVGVLGSNGFDELAGLVDPTGGAAVKSVVKFWTLEQRNFDAIPVMGIILYNRLFWLTISALIFWWTYSKFEFNQFAHQSSIDKKKKQKDTIQENKIPSIDIPSVKTNFSFLSQLKTSWHLSTLDFRSIVMSWPFIAILFAGGVLVLFQQYQMSPQEGVVSIPTTANMLRFPMFFFTAIVNLLTFLYVGVLVYKGKLNRMDGLLDSTPQPDWVVLMSKLIAVLKMQFVLLSLVMISGLIAQVIGGYYRFEFWHYLFELFILQGVHFFAWACLAFCVHSVFKNLYLGYFVLLLVPVANLFLPGLADYLNLPILKENLFQFNSVKDMFLGFDYSEFNGYGSQLTTYFAYKTYWLIGSIGLLIIALLFWKRGRTFSINERMNLVKLKFNGQLKYSFIFGFILFVSTGFAIFYQENYVSKIYFSDNDQLEITIQNEKLYGHLENSIQPRLVNVKMTMDVFPETKDFIAKGTFIYENKSDHAIDTIIIAKSFKEMTSANIKRPHQIISEDDLLHYKVVKLDDKLISGDSIEIEYEIKNYPNSFLHHNSRAQSNGTYITDNIIPKLGIRSLFLSNAKERKKHGLPERIVQEYLPSDSTLLGYEFNSNTMGQINYECTMSTSIEQTPITMGQAKSRWIESNRTFIKYKSKIPITSAMSWHSGVYQKQSSNGKHQALEMYRHPVQNYNDNHFFNGLNTSISYCSDWFGPLGFDTMKIVVYPETHGTYATVHGNIIPYSETYFKCDVHDHENDVFNMPFFVSAHEIAHCWWGHRVDPANIPGGRMITEGMADYLAMKAIEVEYDSEKVLEFRKKYNEIYLKERANLANETPLIHSSLENEYLNYRKASLSIYAMSEYLGETVLNSALARFEKRFRNTEPPFATSLDFVDYIRQVTPDSLQYLIHDMFETITLYDNSLSDVGISKKNDLYTVDFNLTISKYRADSKGKRNYGELMISEKDKNSLSLNDFIEIGFFGLSGELIEVKRIRVNQIENGLSYAFKEKITGIVIDPNYLLMDVNRDNDEWKEY